VIGAREDVLQRGGCTRCSHGDYSLMIAGVGQAIELAAVFKANGNSALPCELHDFFDARVLAALGDEDAVESSAGFDSFANGVNAGETIHGEEVYS
jgi:hypothetical protein